MTGGLCGYGIPLRNDGYNGAPDSRKSTFAEVKQRIKGHGDLPYSQAHYYLWQDAQRLVVLLEEANRKIKELESSVDSKDQFVEPDLSVSVPVGVTVSFAGNVQHYTVDVPVDIHLKVNAK